MAQPPNKSLIAWILGALGIGGAAGTGFGDQLIDLITNRHHTHVEYVLKGDQVELECDQGVRWVDDGNGGKRLVE